MFRFLSWMRCIGACQPFLGRRLYTRMPLPALTSRSVAALALGALFLTTAGALSVVGLRQQSMRVASRCYELEQQLQMLERKNAFLGSKIAQLENPRFLQHKISRQLRPMSSEQVVWAKDMPARPSQPHEHPLSQPNMVALHLATLKKVQDAAKPSVP